MRLQLAAALLLTTALAAPAAAQSERIDRRVERLEQELRAVQRKVFPGNNGAAYVEPEIGQATPGRVPIGVPATSAIADVTARIDALEAQLRTLTGQAEENGFRMRQIEEGMARLRSDTEARFAAAAQAAAPPPEPEPEPEAPARPSASVSADAVADPEQAYNEGFRLWEAKDYAGAQKLLEAVAKAHPKHRRASWARNLAGRAYLDEGKAATAAKLLLANYQADPKGERAADSLYFLGAALVLLKRPAEACKVYDELQDVYGAGMRDWVKQRLPKARSDANCS